MRTGVRRSSRMSVVIVTQLVTHALFEDSGFRIL